MKVQCTFEEGSLNVKVRSMVILLVYVINHIWHWETNNNDFKSKYAFPQLSNVNLGKKKIVRVVTQIQIMDLSTQ